MNDSMTITVNVEVNTDPAAETLEQMAEVLQNAADSMCEIE